MTTMTHPPQPTRRVLGGVDTHKDVHVAAMVDDTGRLLATGSFPTTTLGYRQLWRWMRSHGDVVAVGVEGTGAWGAGLARYLRAEGADVREVMRPNRQHRRRYGKSDEADAIGAARAVLSGEAVGVPQGRHRSGGSDPAAAHRPTQRDESPHPGRQPDPRRRRHRPRGAASTLRQPPHGDHRRRGRPLPRPRPDTPLEAARFTLRSLARRWQYLADELTMLDAHLDELTATTAPTLRAINGVGPQVATALLAAAGDNPDRLRSSSSFAALCGVSPIDASSGRQQHHRLNRYGDRHANWALHVIVISRLRWHAPTKAYMARRLAQGPTSKMIIRCLKRHVVREVYRAITADLGHHHEPTRGQPIAA